MIIETSLISLSQIIRDKIIIADENIKNLYPFLFNNRLTFLINANEQNKSLSYLENIAQFLLDNGVKRNSEIVLIGGGMVGDIGGLLASLYFRGIDYSFVPTSIIAMADSAIGGKTAVNLGSVKNALGGFKNAKNIYYCYEFLDSLPKEEIYSGMGEIIKTALISKRVYDTYNKNADLITLIRECRKFKQRVVKKDFYDNKGIRSALNLGHTLGHAIELDLSLSHGIAVAMGLRLESVFYPKNIREWVLNKTDSLIPKHELDLKKIVSIAKNDKKNQDKIAIISLKKIGKIETLYLSDENLLRELIRHDNNN